MRYVSTRNRFLETPETTDDKWVALIESQAGLLLPCGRASTLRTSVRITPCKTS